MQKGQHLRAPGRALPLLFAVLLAWPAAANAEESDGISLEDEAELHIEAPAS